MKKYGSYTDADLNDWQKLPAIAPILTSSAFGAWLQRRDENKREKGDWFPCNKRGIILTEWTARHEPFEWYGYKCSSCGFIYKGNALTQSPYCQYCGSLNVPESEAEP